MIFIVIYFDILFALVLEIFIGISRPNLDPTKDYLLRDCTDGWFMRAEYGGLWGNGKEDAAAPLTTLLVAGIHEKRQKARNEMSGLTRTHSHSSASPNVIFL